MASLEERLSRLEGGYEHLATKADLAELRAEMQAMETRLLIRLTGVIVAVMAVGIGVLRITGNA